MSAIDLLHPEECINGRWQDVVKKNKKKIKNPWVRDKWLFLFHLNSFDLKLTILPSEICNIRHSRRFDPQLSDHVPF